MVNRFSFASLAGLRAVASLVLLASAVPASMAQPGTTWRVSISSEGAQGVNGNSLLSSISSDGRYVAFESLAQGLVPDDTNYRMDIFVRDRLNGTTERVSVGPFGAQASVDSERPNMSTDGRLIVFQSAASELVPGDTNQAIDVFVHDRNSGVTSLVSRANGGGLANGSSFYAKISADGRFVAYESYASNLVLLDTNGKADIFVTELQTGITQRVSRATNGTQANWDSSRVSLSSDGQYVSFASGASNLVANDTNNREDVFVHQRQTQQTWRVSVASDGTQGNAGSYISSLSGDGRYVAFYSEASNLVAGDTNSSYDIFVHDRTTATTKRISLSSSGAQANSTSYDPEFSTDGRFVGFWSYASNLVTGDTNGWSDTFVRDLETGQTTRVSIASNGTQGNSDGGVISTPPSLTSGGEFVSFTAGSSNLVSGDTNNRFDVFVRQVRDAPATVSGKVVLIDFVGDVDAQKVDAEIREAGGTVVQSIFGIDLGPCGEYSFRTSKLGTYTVAMKRGASLRQAIPNVVITSTGVTNLDFSLAGGDIDGDNAVTVFDYNVLSDAFDSVEGDSHWNAAADLDGDLAVTVFDYNILSANFDREGD